jgi:hypothetical protein
MMCSVETFVVKANSPILAKVEKANRYIDFNKHRLQVRVHILGKACKILFSIGIVIGNSDSRVFESLKVPMANFSTMKMCVLSGRFNFL